MGQTSNAQFINSSVIQGSALGPVCFAAVASTPQPVNLNNYLFKYADDTYLVVPQDNIQTTNAEIKHIQT